jgi:hypothetical protein
MSLSAGMDSLTSTKGIGDFVNIFIRSAKSTRKRIARITRQVISIISQRGGGFLKYGERRPKWKEGWYEVGKEDTTYEKVGHALRGRTIQTRKQAPKTETKVF